MDTDPSTPRRFCRFRSDAPADSSLYSRLPDDGMCLSAFVLLRSHEGAPDVLAGRLDPAGPWDEIGALPVERVASSARGWMLPACHVALFESPDDAAARVVREQLGVDSLPLGRARVFSEAYDRENDARDPHWDLHFVYEGAWPVGRARTAPAWRQLEFVDLRTTPPTAFVRAHADILALAGTPARGRE